MSNMTVDSVRWLQHRAGEAGNVELSCDCIKLDTAWRESGVAEISAMLKVADPELVAAGFRVSRALA